MHSLPGRLLIVSHVYVVEHGGEVYLHGGFGRFVDEIATRFDEVLLMTCAEEAAEPPDDYRLRADNVSLSRLRPYSQGGRLRRYSSMLASAAQSALKLPGAVYRCDALHSRLPSVVGGLGAVAARLSGKPTFFYVAGDWEQRLLYRNQSAPARALASLVHRGLRGLVGGELCFVAGEPLAKKFDGPGRDIVPVITTSIDQRHVLPEAEVVARVAGDPREVLFVGLVWEMKGLHVLLEAIRRLHDRGVPARLRIIGSSHDGGKWLRERMEALELTSAVEWRRHMDWDHMMTEYEKSDVFVMPSLEGRGETGPKVVLEAMARGVPVVASRVGFVPTIVRHMENGWIVSPGSSEGIAKALEALWRDADLRIRFARSGLQTASRHTLQGLVDQMVGEIAERAAMEPTSAHESAR